MMTDPRQMTPTETLRRLGRLYRDAPDTEAKGVLWAAVALGFTPDEVKEAGNEAYRERLVDDLVKVRQFTVRAGAILDVALESLGVHQLEETWSEVRRVLRETLGTREDAPEDR